MIIKGKLFFSRYFSSRPSSSFKHNASFVSRLPTIRRHKSTSLHSPSLHKLVHQGYQSQRGNVTRGFADLIASAENLGEFFFSFSSTSSTARLISILFSRIYSLLMTNSHYYSLCCFSPNLTSVEKYFYNVPFTFSLEIDKKKTMKKTMRRRHEF